MIGGMMKRLLVLASLILTASLIGQVEHAPTVAQCQADQRLWLARLESAEGKDITLPSMSVLRVWRKEMKDCESVDAENYWKYFNTKSELWVEEVIRLQDFVDRHGLSREFEAEDAAGKR
jgi:hypothetical protein